MINISKTLLVCFFIVLSPIVYSQDEDPTDDPGLLPCKIITLKMFDRDEPHGDIKKEATIVFSCHNRRPFIPDQSIIHLIESSPEKVCYTERSCGNIKAWGGFFSVAGVFESVTVSTLGNFLKDNSFGLPFALIPTGPKIELRLSMKFDRINRSCTEFSRPICFSR